MTRVLIAGCGYVGTELARALTAERDNEVWGLRRSPAAMPAGVHAVVADLARIGTLTRLPPRLDAVVYAVGADGHTPEQYESAYVTGLANLWESLRTAGTRPHRLVVVTSTAVYAQNDGEWVDESSPTEPKEFSGRTLLRSEALARSLADEVVIVRFGGIYGPGRTRFIDTVRDGSAALAAGAEYTNRIHQLDCAGVLAHLLRLASPAPHYVGVDDEPADRRVVVEWIARRLGVTAPPPPAASGGDVRPRGKRCSNRLLRSSGYVFRFPTFREGYADVLARG
jgi:nucleoside-diphosphate-sugar epimerase